jgi:hypothetical protein
MTTPLPKSTEERRTIETREWLDSLDAVLQTDGPTRLSELLRDLSAHAAERGVVQPFTANTPYLNTIHVAQQPIYPGNREIERRIKSLVRWNAMAMVVRANQVPDDNIGGHISTYASAATLYEVGFNHFFRGRSAEVPDIVYFQGHASPGIYARAFLEGRQALEDVPFWRRVGEEYREPLIVTGVVDFESIGPYYQERQVGRRTLRLWLPQFSLALRLLLIDGATGERIASAICGRIVAHSVDTRERALTVFHRLIDRTMPSVLAMFGRRTIVRSGFGPTCRVEAA